MDEQLNNPETQTNAVAEEQENKLLNEQTDA